MSLLSACMVGLEKPPLPTAGPYQKVATTTRAVVHAQRRGSATKRWSRRLLPFPILISVAVAIFRCKRVNLFLADVVVHGRVLLALRIFRPCSGRS